MRCRMDLSKNNVYGSFGGTIFGCVAWLLCFSVMTGDWPSSFFILAAAIAMFVIATKACLRRPQHYYQIVRWVLVGVTGLNLTLINLRYPTWIETYRKSPFYESANDMLLWKLNLLVFGLFGALFILLTFMEQRGKIPLNPIGDGKSAFHGE
ncbi:MAG TPA: hypothetical protein PK395_07835 [bacterium]|nr:hypothetical protein [bacterium]